MNTPSQKLKSQLLSAFGHKGQQWIDELPTLIKKCSDQWQLDNLIAFHPLSWNFVAKGRQMDRSVVLKIGCDVPALEREINALKVFPKGSCVEVIAYDPLLGAALLETAEPGKELFNHSKDSHEIVALCCELANRLKISQRPSTYRFDTIREQLLNLEKNWPQIPNEFLQTARKLKAELIRDMSETHIIHGDLHRQNILSHGKSWIVIDPKGYLGSLYNEVWTFIHEPQTEIPLAARNLNLNETLLLKWCFIHSILSATWCIEDRVPPKNVLGPGEKIFPLLPS